jgi:hypothetical protein
VARFFFAGVAQAEGVVPSLVRVRVHTVTDIHHTTVLVEYVDPQSRRTRTQDLQLQHAAVVVLTHVAGHHFVVRFVVAVRRRYSSAIHLPDIGLQGIGHRHHAQVRACLLILPQPRLQP